MFRVCERVVVLINDIKKIDDLLKKGIEFASEHKKRLEVLFVHETPTFSLPDYFFSSHSKKARLDRDRVESKIKEDIRKIDSDIKTLLFIVEGTTLDTVLSHAKGSTDILFITSYEKRTTQRLLKKTPYSYLILKNSSSTHNHILMPIELDDSTKDDIKLIKDIFPKSSIEIVHDYRYRIPSNEGDIVPVVGHIDSEIHQETRANEREVFESYKKEFNIQGDFIEEKESLNVDLLNYIKSQETDLIVIHHQEELLFSPSVTFNLLDKVSSDFLILNR